MTYDDRCLELGAAALYPLGEPSGDAVLDAVSGQNLALSGTGYTRHAPPLHSGGRSTVLGGGAYIDASGITVFSGFDRTYSVWFRLSGTGQQRIINWDDGVTIVRISHQDGRVLLNVGQGIQHPQSTHLNDQLPHLIVLSIGQSGYKAYLDGVLCAEASWGSLPYSSGDLGEVIGRHRFLSDFYWRGALQGLALFDRALNQAEAVSLYIPQHPPPTDEEVFRASFEAASGRDPLPTALLARTPARQLAGHNVNVYRYPPYLVTKRLPIRLEDYDLTKPGLMMWHRDPRDPLFRMGRWAQIQGRRFTDSPLEVELTLRISDHPESFEAPT